MTTQAAHTPAKGSPTPGPWRVDRTMVRANDGPIVCRVSVEASQYDTDVFEANARLIAQAPALLAALQRALPWLGKMIADGGHLESVLPNDAIGALEQAEAALAAVRGEKS